MMLLSTAIPHPKDKSKTPFNGLFGNIGKYQKKYTNESIRYIDHGKDSFFSNSDPNKMVLQILPFSSYKVYI